MDDIEAPRATVHTIQATDAKGDLYPARLEPRANEPIPSKNTKRAWQLGLVWSEQVRHTASLKDYSRAACSFHLLKLLRKVTILTSKLK
jgi:hypothetical protein